MVTEVNYEKWSIICFYIFNSSNCLQATKIILVIMVTSGGISEWVPNGIQNVVNENRNISS